MASGRLAKAAAKKIVSAKVALVEAVRRTKTNPKVNPIKKSTTAFNLSSFVIFSWASETLHMVNTSQWGIISKRKWEKNAVGRAIHGFLSFSARTIPIKVWTVASIALV